MSGVDLVWLQPAAEWDAVAMALEGSAVEMLDDWGTDFSGLWSYLMALPISEPDWQTRTFWFEGIEFRVRRRELYVSFHCPSSGFTAWLQIHQGVEGLRDLLNTAVCYEVMCT